MLLRAADLLQSPLVTELSLYDIVHAPGVAIDLNHIDTPGKVTGYLPADGGLEKTLVGAEIVVIPAGIARKPGMTRDGIPSILRRPESRSRTNPGVADLFKTNANVIRDLVEGVARFCPKAYVCIITNPVNSTLPIACKVLERHGVLDPRKVFGVTTLDVVRASTFAAHALGIDDPKKYQVPVVGGHSGATILPLFSQSSPAIEFSQGQLDAVTNRERYLSNLHTGPEDTDPTSQVCNSGAMRLEFTRTHAKTSLTCSQIVQAKAGAGSATTCMAYAGFR